MKWRSSKSMSLRARLSIFTNFRNTSISKSLMLKTSNLTMVMRKSVKITALFMDSLANFSENRLLSLFVKKNF
jgi:hypothetical protein